MAINVVLVDGVVKSLSLKYDHQSRPELRFTLMQQEHTADGRTIPLYWACCALGAAAERLASALGDGQHIIVTSGKLCYRKRETKLGEQSRMEVLVWSVDQLTDAAQIERLEATEGGDQGSETPALSPSKRRTRYPRWKPEHAN